MGENDNVSHVCMKKGICPPLSFAWKGRVAFFHFKVRRIKKISVFFVKKWHLRWVGMGRTTVRVRVQGFVLGQNSSAGADKVHKWRKEDSAQHPNSPKHPQNHAGGGGEETKTVRKGAVTASLSWTDSVGAGAIPRETLNSYHTSFLKKLAKIVNTG